MKLHLGNVLLHRMKNIDIVYQASEWFMLFESLLINIKYYLLLYGNTSLGIEIKH